MDDLETHVSDNGPDGKIPLGLCKQVSMKFDSIISDLYEIKEDPDLDDEDRNTVDILCETCGLMNAHIVNMIKKECDEEDFLNENINMDSIESYPESEQDILDAPLDES